MLQFFKVIDFIGTTHPNSILFCEAEPCIFKGKVAVFFCFVLFLSFYFFSFLFNCSNKQPQVVLTEDDTTLSLADRQIKMHPSPSPAPPPAICSSPVIGLQPPSPVNKLFVHLCYKQDYRNNQGLKCTAERKQNPPKGRWLTSLGVAVKKQNKAMSGRSLIQRREKFLRMLQTLKENALFNHSFGEEFCYFSTDNLLLMSLFPKPYHRIHRLSTSL